MVEHELGRYTGRLILEPLPDGRTMRTLDHFGFMEADGLHWPVPPNTTVDGASIPQALWSIMGGPFEGKYRDASVVHDYYCDVRSADWRAVHQVFYRAMLVSGVSVRRAKIMYAAVYFAGPKWSDTAVKNVRLGPPAIPHKPDQDNGEYRCELESKTNVLFTIQHDPITDAMSKMIEKDGMTASQWIEPSRIDYTSDSDITLQLDKLSDLVEKKDLSLREIENAIDKSLGFISNIDASPRNINVGNLTTME